MLATITYLLTVVYVSNTIYNYITCTEQDKVTNCFDEGAEAYLPLIASEEYDYH